MRRERIRHDTGLSKQVGYDLSSSLNLLYHQKTKKQKKQKNEYPVTLSKLILAAGILMSSRNI